MNLSEEQIVALAPDASSLKSGKDLATVSKWLKLQYSQHAVWGECQGSGKLPYQTQVDLTNIAFKCSCPSRKFPCKHGLGLLLLFVKNNHAFSAAEQPSWVTEWIDKRQAKEEKKTEQVEKPVDAEAQAKRAEARQKKVSDGIADLQVWMQDQIRGGLLTVPERAYNFWQNPAKRLVDAQAPGLSAMVKELGQINYYGEQWQYALLGKLARIHLVAEGYKNIDSLDSNVADEVRSLIGFTQSKDELLAQQPVADQWLVLSRTYEDIEQITVERNWLYGLQNGRFALVLQFIAGRQTPELNLVPASVIDAELVYYKGIQSVRALVKLQKAVKGSLMPNVFRQGFAQTTAEFASAIAANPFMEKQPFLLDNIRCVKSGNNILLLDSENHQMQALISERSAKLLLAVTGGLSCKMFALGNETQYEPLAIWFNNKYISLGNAVQG